VLLFSKKLSAERQTTRFRLFQGRKLDAKTFSSDKEVIIMKESFSTKYGGFWERD
jgi:hypothetical protein